MLDEHCRVAKLADMGLAKFFSVDKKSTTMPGPRGTAAYLDPMYLDTYRYTPASDVYSFGLVLLQVITATPSPQKALRQARSAWEKGSFSSLVDSEMPGKAPEAVVAELIKLGLQCTNWDIKKRPEMGRKPRPSVQESGEDVLKGTVVGALIVIQTKIPPDAIDDEDSYLEARSAAE